MEASVKCLKYPENEMTKHKLKKKTKKRIKKLFRLILKHNIFTFVIWENINDNRACYIFRYKAQYFDEKIKNLIKFINSDIEYKRWDLFNNKGKSNSLNYEEYHTVIHENTESYKQKLNHYLSPNFL